MNKNIKFLKDKYEFHKDKWVHNTVNRSNTLNNAKISISNIEDSISNFLERYNNILENKENNSKSFEALKRMIFSECIIKSENIPENYWELQKKIIIDRWQWWYLIKWEIPEEGKKVEIEKIIKEQKDSLSIWIDYLSDESCPYDISMKYFILREISKLDYEFWKRNKKTIKNFPELNREHLAQTIDLIEKSINWEKINLEDKDLEKSVKNKNFSEIYKYFLNKNTKINSLENIKWEWKKYNQNSDHMSLVESIKWKNTGWCTAWGITAEKQLKTWDFYVYYTENEDGKNINPRLAIRMEWEKIAEIRWILPWQEIDEYIIPVLNEKLKEFWSEADEYREKEANMKFLTEITNKLDNEENLTKEELIFLFEFEKKIKNFWYRKDPRIKQNKEKLKDLDLLNIFDWSIRNIEWDLYLSSIETLPEWINFPENIEWDLNLRDLKNISQNIKLPEKIWWSLYLEWLTRLPNWFEFPKDIGFMLALEGLSSLPENFIFPEKVWLSLNLNWLKTLPKNIKFPKYIWWYLNLTWLTSLQDGLELPKNALFSDEIKEKISNWKIKVNFY